MSGKAAFAWCGLFLSLGWIMPGCRSRNSATSEQPSIVSNTGPITESDLGVPIYPNSTADHNQSFSFQGHSRSPNSVKTVSASLSTTDSVDQVESFYREKLDGSVQIQEHRSGSGTLVDMFLEKPKAQVRIQVVPQATGKGAVIVILTQLRS